jgi:N-acetylglucosamine kinase-like BadF-type ATPase
VVRSGGLGYLLGDEGSGFDLGKLGLKSSLNAHFAGKNTQISAEICQSWKIADINQALNVIYKEANPAPKIAEIAPIILGLAEKGDETALNILAQSMSALSLQIEMTAQQLEFEGVIPLCIIGGLSNRRELLESLIQNHLPSGKYEFTAPQYKPAIGAILFFLKNSLEKA